MTEDEQKMLLEAIKRNAPVWYERIRTKQEQKKSVISTCINIAGGSDCDDYQNEINRLLQNGQTKLNSREQILLNYVCLIKHKESLNSEVVRDDTDIQKWLSVLIRYSDESAEPVISILERKTRQTIKRYKEKNPVGRPKGSGKRIYMFNGKEYRTIQECADDYGITKQGMYKKMKKLQVL